MVFTDLLNNVYETILYAGFAVTSVLSEYWLGFLMTCLMINMFFLICLICVSSSGESALSRSYISTQKSSNKEDIRVYIIYFLIFIFVVLVILISKVAKSVYIIDV